MLALLTTLVALTTACGGGHSEASQRASLKASAIVTVQVAEDPRFEVGVKRFEDSWSITSLPKLTSTLAKTASGWVSRQSPRDVSLFDLFSPPAGGGAAYEHEVGTTSVEELLDYGLQLAGVSPVHLAARGVASSDTVRCEWRGIARTLQQREEAIRFWLGLSETDAIPSATEVERRFMEDLDRTSPAYPQTVRSNFRAMARGVTCPQALYHSLC